MSSAPAVLPFEPPSPDRPAPASKVGLLAGKGEFPIAFARAAKSAGHDVYCMGVAGLAPPELAEHCRDFRTAPLARLGKAIRYFRRKGVRKVVMAGKIEKKVLFDPWRWTRLLPDYRTLHMWFRYAAANRKDDTILLAVIREFERDGIRFDSALDYCPELLVEHGFLTRKRPTAKQWDDIRFGWELAKEMGRLDVGQTVVVCDQAVIAIEAIEGTDAAIRRAGELCRRGGFTAVKVAKPQQDMRFDVPTIGQRTVEELANAGGKVLAIESGMTIMLDQQEVVALADKLGVAIVSVNAEESAVRMTA